MTKHYTNKPDFNDSSSGVIPPETYFKSMSDFMDDIEAVGKVVKDEGVEDLYSQTGEASLGTTKDSAIFDKSMKRIYSMLTSAKKVHSDIMQNIDSKFTKGMDDAFTTLNNVNSSSKPYKSKYTKQTVPTKTFVGYKADGTSVYIDTTTQKSYTLSEILDGKASPLQAAKDVYDDRIKAVKEMMAKKDQLSDEEIKALEGKTAEEVVAVRYPSQLPEYQKLKANRYYEENKESLQYVDMGIKALAVLVMIGGTVLSGPTGGASLTATYAAGTYLAADSAYSAIKGHTMLTGTQLTTEERIWAGIDSAVTIASMGSAGYLAKLAKSGKNGSTLLKNLATAGTHADDVNDFTKVAYAVGTGKDPSSDIQNLMFGQIMGFGMKQAGNYLGKKFGAPSVDVSGTKPSHLDVPLQTKQIPNLDPANVRLDSRPDLHLKASTADGSLAKLKNHPAVSVDVPKVKQIDADYNDYVAKKTSSGETPLSMSDWKLKVNNLKQNQTVGKEFKIAQTENFKQIANHVENRITIATTVDGQIKKVQVDAIGFDSNGKTRIQDYTASSNISSKRQAILDNIERNGGVIVGKGKGKFVGGVEIPKGTRIDVINSSNQKIENFKMELEKLPHAKLSAEDSASILELKNGERPKPEEIYSKSDIETHLSLFDGGVVKVMSKESFNDANKRFGGSIGHPNGQYVLPKSVYEQALKASNGDPRVLEELLALESGYLGDSPVLIDIKNYQNIRMPSGNEPGAWDGLWVPGGYTKGGIPEAVIDQIQKGDYLISNIFQ